MAAALEIRPLRTDDGRRAFSCGQADLDRFFQHYAGQNQFKLHLAVTYVATADAHILGFATVAVSSLERARLPSSRLRRRLPAYPLPVLRLARLGVYVLKLALDQRDRLGCVGVVTDAKPDAAAFYKRYGFVPLEGVREGALHGDPKPMFLPIGTIGETVTN